MPNGEKPVAATKEMLTINLKWLHLLLIVVTGLLTLGITVATLSNKYVDARIERHMEAHQAAMMVELEKIDEKIAARVDKQVHDEEIERKETMKDLRSDINYIRDKVDDIYARLPARNGR
jgi:acyl-CoA synthetase (AMP-forming)/AMP-acid ligase II